MATQIKSSQIADSAIVASKIATDAVETAKIKNANVTNPKLGITNAWIAVGSAGNPAFLNSWTNYTDGYNQCAFMKDAGGFVHLRGLVKNGTSGIIFQLPVGYRPAYQCLCAVQTNPNTIGRCDVTTGGNVTMAVGSNGWFSLDTVIFLAEQ